jgi:mycofactocin glycosyltransferase
VTTTLPDGFTVRLNRDVRVEDDGAALSGGLPTRVLYLTETARGMIVDRTVRATDRGTELLAQRLLDAGMADPVLDQLPAAQSDELTVVVPVRDRPEALDRLLDSIDPRIRVIVVDDCSVGPDGVARVAAAYAAELVVLSTNLGPAGARNAGLACVSTPYVAFIDSDMVLDPDTLPLVLRHFADPRVALVAPRIMGLMEDNANWIGRYEDARSSLDLGRYPSVVRPLSRVAWLPAACMVARVDALGAGFGLGMRVAEDVDLVWRLAEQGWRIRYEPAVRARHEHRVHLIPWLGRKAFYGTGAYQLGQLHPGNVAPAVFAPWSAVMVLVVLAQRPWSAPAALALAAIATARIAGRLRRSRHPVRLSARLTANGVVSSLFQASELLLRHWWPVAAIGCVLSPRMRRATLAAALVDAAIELARTDARLDPVRFALLRRLDDLAYGAGVWFGVIRGRSPRALIPKIIRTHHSR